MLKHAPETACDAGVAQQICMTDTPTKATANVCSSEPRWKEAMRRKDTELVGVGSTILVGSFVEATSCLVESQRFKTVSYFAKILPCLIC